ncbi:MAG: tRNA modification GTPase MnmE [Planctomycetota bacterium]|jgi:tRNA modification GTPase
MRGARDTIVAVASPPGRGLRAIVRASGPAVREIARRAIGSVPSSRGVSRVRLRMPAHDGDAGVACPALLSWMESPASFTGEDSLEISCVGSPALVEQMVHALIGHAAAAGHAARLALPGEFAWRAHLAGRLSVDEAEGIAARIAATSDAELAASVEVARGVYGARAAELCARTAELLARVEAGIDFTDQEDVVSVHASDVRTRCDALAAEIAALRGAAGGARAHAVPLVVLAGEPNAGKSSLFNAMLGRTRSVESALAGTTRDAVIARVALAGGIEIDLADLAGLERVATARAPREIAEAMQRRAQEMLAIADLVVRCTPVGAERVPLAREDGIVEVATMCDRAGVAGRTPSDAIATSARDRAGIAALKHELAARLRTDRTMRRAQLAAILPRHDAAFEQARAAIVDAAALAAADIARGDRLHDPELAAGLLRAALDALGSVAGPVHPDDVLGLVFSRFCIGK